MFINGYKLENPEKVDRAIHGSMSREGSLEGGVGESDENAILARYDQLGGYITLEGRKVKNGCFFEAKTGKPVKTPEVVLQLRDLDGHLIEVGVDEEIPVEVQAAEARAAGKPTPKVKIAKKGKKEVKALDVEEEE